MSIFKKGLLLGVFVAVAFFFVGKTLAVAPSITNVKYTGSKIAVFFDQPVFTALGGLDALVPNDFTLGGVHEPGIEVTSVAHSTTTLPNVVVLTVSAPIVFGGPGEWTVSVADNEVYNAGGEAVATGETDLIGREDAVSPLISSAIPFLSATGVPVITFVKGIFNEYLDVSTVNTTNLVLKANTPNTSDGTPGGANLCLSATMSSSTLECGHLSDMVPLATSTWYTFAMSGVTDLVGNTIEATSTVFQTGSFLPSMDETPPIVVSTFPAPGSFDFPLNGNLFIEFPQGNAGNMATDGVGSVTDVTNIILQTQLNGQPSGLNICASAGCTLTWDATARKLKVDPASNLAASSEFILTIKNTVKNVGGQSIPGPDFLVFFRTSASADSTPPTFTAMQPAHNSTGVLLNVPDIMVQFSKDVDAATVTTSTVKLFADANANSVFNDGETIISDFNTSVRYESRERAAHVGIKTILTTSARYCIQVVSGGSGVKDTVGTQFVSDAIKCFTTSDQEYAAVAPKVVFADADNFKLWITFDQSINGADAVNKDNYVIENPLNSTMNTATATFTYRPEARAVEVTGLALQTNSDFRVTITGVRDISNGATMVANGTTNVAHGIVLDSNTTGGFIGTQTQDFSQTNFGTFWENPERCAPRSRVVGQTTTVECEFSTPAALATGSKIILTFPTGFNVESVIPVSTSNSFMNKDLNGPGPGITTIASSVTSTSANTVTLTLNQSGGTMGSSDHLNFELSGLVNSSNPGENQVITIIVKDESDIKRGQTISPSPFNINIGGAYSVSGKVCKSSGSGGACTGEGITGISGVSVFLESMGGFGDGGIMSGRQSIATGEDGSFTFAGLSGGQYGVGMFLDPVTAGDVIGGGGGFQSVLVTSTSITGIDFKLTDLSSTGKTATVTITGGPASETVDVFCFAPGNFQFSTPVMKSGTLNGSGAGTITFKLQPNVKYECGIGPSIPRESMLAGGPPPVPDFNFLPPPPQTVTVVDEDVAFSFALATTDKQINGKVVDSSGTGIANVFVDAFPAFGKGLSDDGTFKEMHGGFAQTKSDGTFVLKVINGTYMVSACSAGMPCTSRVEVTAKDNSDAVDSNSSTDVYSNGTLLTGVGLTLKISKTSLTIAGEVQDENGNGIKYAFVDAQKVGASDTCTNFTPQGGFAGSPSDSEGNYTLYISAGTWRVAAHAGAYGDVACSIITVTDSSKTGQNLKATTADYGTISGLVTKAGSAVGGAQVTCYGPAGGNNTVSGSDGTYSIKMKAGTGYTCEGFLPGAGQLTPQTNVTVTSGATTDDVNLVIGNPGTVTITVAGMTDAFCDVRSSTGKGDGTGQNASGVYTIKVPAGTYTARCGNPKYGELGSQAVTVTAGGSHSVTFTALTLYTVAGRVTNGSSNLDGASVTFTDITTGRIAFVQSSGATGSNNNVSTSLPVGNYSVTASKSGYVDPGAAESLVVTGNTTFTLRALTKATANASITIQKSGSNYTGTSRVIATNTDGKVVVAEADKAVTSGANISLPLTNGTWTVQAFGDNGYSSVTSSIVVSGGTPNATPTLSLASAISGFTATSTRQQTITPTNGGVFKDASIGSDFEVNIPSNVLSTSDSSAGTIETKMDPSIAVSTPGKTFIGKAAIDITPKDSNGKEIKELSATGKSVTIKIPYTDADLTAAGVTDETTLSIGSWNDAAGEWEALPTTVDAENNVLIVQTTHFSEFAPIAATSGSAPATPTGLALSADATQITLTWTAVSGATSYDIYRSATSGGVYARVGSEPTVGAVTTYINTGLSGGTTYYYRITALNDAGESAQSSAVSVATLSSSGGGGGGGYSPTPVTVPAETVATSTVQTPVVTSTPRSYVPTAEMPFPAERGTVNAKTGVSETFTKVITNKLFVVSNGTDFATVTVKLKADAKNPVTGKTVTLTSSKDGDVITPATAVADANGNVTFTVKSTKSGASVVTAKIDDSKLTTRAVVNFVAQPKDDVKVGDMVKLQCPTAATANNPCRAVYYVGQDGYRHPFPQDKVFYTWFTDFKSANIKTVGSDAYATLPIGKPVPLKTDTKLIMITGESNVYAVEPDGLLRRIKSEVQAKTLFGNDWAKKVIDLSSSLFSGTYAFGSDLKDNELPAGATVKGTDNKMYKVDGEHKKVLKEATEESTYIY